MNQTTHPAPLTERPADPLPAPRWLDPHPDPPTDAIRVLLATMHDDHVPFGVNVERMERAQAYATVCMARRKDEAAVTIARVNRAVDQLASAIRAAKKNDAIIREKIAALQAQWNADDAAAQAASLTGQDADPDALTTQSKAEILVNVLRAVLTDTGQDDNQDGGKGARLRPRPKTDPKGPHGQHADARPNVNDHHAGMGI